MVSVLRGVILMWINFHRFRCTEVNVALNKNASTTSGVHGNWYPSGAVDGDHVTLNDPSSCFHSAGAPADWTVDLGQVYQLYNIKVYLRTGYQRRSANSTIYSEKDMSRVCYTFPSNISDNPMHVTCNETAQYLTIMNPGKAGDNADTLNICEIEIFACSNGSYGSNCELDCHCTSCERWSGICSGGCHAGWMGRRCDTACATTHYGENCTSECSTRSCEGDSPCDSMTGQCDGGCQDGWTGVDCMVCAATHYGKDCNSECSARHCARDSPCDSKTGRCDGGCLDRWTGVHCTVLIEETSNTALILSATALTAIGVLIIVFIIVGVLLWKNRVKNQSQPSHNNPMTLSTIPHQDVHLSSDESSFYTVPGRVDSTPPEPYESLKIHSDKIMYQKTLPH